MKKQILIIAMLCFGLGQADAQEVRQEAHHEAPALGDTLHGRRPPFAEVPNPEEVAKRQTDRLQKELQLTEKQYKKIYKLNLKEQQEMLEQRPQGGPGPRMDGGGHRPMRPEFDGQPPMGMDGGDFPPQMGEGNRPPMPPAGDRKERAEEWKKKAEKRAKQRDKKMKKILTDEQYARWKEIG